MPRFEVFSDLLFEVEAKDREEAIEKAIQQLNEWDYWRKDFTIEEIKD